MRVAWAGARANRSCEFPWGRRHAGSRLAGWWHSGPSGGAWRSGSTCALVVVVAVAVVVAVVTAVVLVVRLA